MLLFRPHNQNNIHIPIVPIEKDRSTKKTSNNKRYNEFHVEENKTKFPFYISPRYITLIIFIK